MKWIRWIDTAVAFLIVALVVIARGPSLPSALGGVTPNGAAICSGRNGNSTFPTCGGGFTGSIHDFAGSNSTIWTSAGNSTNVPLGQCTRCHTPHNAIMTTLLWNHHLSNNTQFTWSDATYTMAGTQYATIANSWPGSTTKCLSCHDGSVSSSTINWYYGGTPQAGTARGQGIAGLTVGVNGSMNGNHPVAMPYPCNNAPSTYNLSSTGGQIIYSEWVAQPAYPIRLYQQAAAGVTRAPLGGCFSGTAGIECGSCHDVHNDEDVDIYLLRGRINGTQAQGYICELCHNK